MAAVRDPLVVKLDKFVPREYQMPFIEAFEKSKLKRFIIIWPRRSGKDLCMLSLVVRKALKRVGNYFYIFDTYRSGRNIIWDAIDNDGNKVLDYYIPHEIIDSKNEQYLRIRLINGSQITIVGSNDVDRSLVGTNAVGMVFSEFALQNPKAWELCLPILRGSDGWAAFCSTPRGHNHFYDLYKMASKDSDWFCEKLTVEDTKHIPLELIESDIEKGLMSRDLALQEYWTDFSLGIEGSYYGKVIDQIRRNEQIGAIHWDPSLPVVTAWDIGWNDLTVIIFAQITKSGNLHIIDYYQNNKHDLAHYVKYVFEKPYTYSKHFAPFDIAVTEWGTGVTRIQRAYDLGLQFVKYAQDQKFPSLDDGIESVRAMLPLTYFNASKCKDLVKALENYRQEFDEKNRVYKGTVAKSNFNHAADAMRYLCYAVPKLKTTSDPVALEKRYNEAMYGARTNLPDFFK